MQVRRYRKDERGKDKNKEGARVNISGERQGRRDTEKQGFCRSADIGKMSAKKDKNMEGQEYGRSKDREEQG